MTARPVAIKATSQQIGSGERMHKKLYRISVRGHITERLGSALEGMRLEAGPANSAFTGEVRDQSHLYGLLDRVRDLGLELVSVEPHCWAGPLDGGRETLR
jgi:hypothetical protein